ncbi:MAG: cytidine deaminase [Gemmatimonadales bacterium]
MADSLEARARAVREMAYARYSGFQVGAAIEGEGGEVFVGCNVENASSGLTICAERSAAAAAVAAGVRRFRRVVVVTAADTPTPPCGACRQVLWEFGPDLVVESVGSRSRKLWRMLELLPDAFGPESLT